jgi:D-sedoheptulose 7-phosphate isomerase
MSSFPTVTYADAGRYAADYFRLLAEAASTVDRQAVTAAGKLLAEKAAAGGTMFSCGNGGSAAIANHLACDCLKGVRSNSFLRPRVQSLSTPVELVTAIANDIGVEQIFSYPLESLAGPGDVLIAISSSGNSPNIKRVLESARSLGVETIAMTGFGGGVAAQLADINLHVRCDNYGIVEDVHQSLMHILAQFLRQSHLEEPASIQSLKF